MLKLKCFYLKFLVLSFLLQHRQQFNFLRSEHYLHFATHFICVIEHFFLLISSQLWVINALMNCKTGYEMAWELKAFADKLNNLSSITEVYIVRERTISQKLTSFPPMCPDVHVCTCASVLQINKCYKKKKISDQNQIGFKISGGLVFPLLPAFFPYSLRYVICFL